MLRRHWVAALLFIALTSVLTNPLVLHLWNAVEDKQDALLNTWIIAWVGHAAITDPLNLYNANIFYPYPNTLALSEVLVPQGMLALPFTLATDNPIFSYNLVLLAMSWFNAFAMYLLVYDWTHSRAAGWVSGAIYAFNPFNLGNLAQIQLVSLGWLPLAILYLRRLLAEKVKKPYSPLVTQDAILFSLFFALQALSSIYFALLAGLATGIFLLWWVLTRLINYLSQRPSPVSRTLQNTSIIVASRSTRGLLRFAFSLVIIAAILIPFLLPYFSVQRALGLERRVEDSEPFSASLKQFTEVSPENVAYGRWLAPNPVKYDGGYPLDNLFPGFAALVLAGIGLGVGRLRERWFLLLLLAVAFVLSLGPRLYLTADKATDLTLPYRWLFNTLPFMRALRAPVRFEALIMFALAALGGLGMTVRAVQRHATILAIGAVLLIAVEYFSLPAANTTVVPVASEIQEVYRWLARQPPSVVLELPMMGPNAQNQLDISKQYFTTFHWQRTPDGYSGFIPARRGELAYEMQFFPSARAVSLMEALGLRYLVVHFDELAQRGTPVDRGRLEQIPGLKLEQDLGAVSVYDVGPPAFNAAQLEKRLYLPQPAQAGARYVAYLILFNSAGTPFAVRPTDTISFVARWSDGRTERVSTPLRLVTSEASVVPILLQAPARQGKSSLQIETEGGLIGQTSLAGEVEVGKEAAQEIVIPASVKLDKPLMSEYPQGTTVTVGLDWRPLNKIDAYYSVSVRVVDAEGNKVAWVDREPRVPVMNWIPGVQVADEFDLRLPDSLAPGKYRVELLMYNASDQTSVLMLDQNLNPQDTFALGEFELK